MWQGITKLFSFLVYSLLKAKGIFLVVIACACVSAMLVNTITQKVHGNLTIYL